MTICHLSSLVLCGSLAVAASPGWALPAINLSSVADGTGGFAINGEGLAQYSGRSVSGAGDVNGDGIADLIVGAQRYPTFPNSPGRAYVVLGRTNAGPAIELSNIAAGTGGFAIDGTSGDVLGASVAAAGDVNGDGLADVIIGAPNASRPGATGIGKAFVILGKVDGTLVSVSALASLGFAIEGQAAYDAAGSSVSGAGDVNGDGLADVIVGAPNHNAPAFPPVDGGRAYVVFGRTATSTVFLSAVAEVPAGGFAINGAEGYDHAGRAVAGAGDVNGDGLADVVVGVPEADASASLDNTNEGIAYVLWGKTGTNQVYLSQFTFPGVPTDGFPITGQVSRDQLGIAVGGAGDVNGDGLGDIVIGARYADPNNASNSGRTYVVHGRTSVTTVRATALAAGSGGFVIDGEVAGGQSGVSVSSAGDVDGDGLLDVLVGAHLIDANGPAPGLLHGRAYIVLGHTATTRVFLSAVTAGNGGAAINGATASAYTGRSVSAIGDMNGDGLSDVVVGAYKAFTNDTDFISGGRAFVVFSTATPAAEATAHTTYAAGDAPRAGVGSHQFGGDPTQWAAARACIDFSEGSGPGLNGSSNLTCTLARTDGALSGFSGGITPVDVANVHWSMTSTRTASTAQVSLRYLDSEIAGLAEGDLRLFSAPSASGPWAALPGFSLDATRNEASASLDGLGLSPRYLALVAVGPVANGDADKDEWITVGDLTAMHNQIANIATLPMGGDGDVDNDSDVDLMDCELLREHLVNNTPLP